MWCYCEVVVVVVDVELFGNCFEVGDDLVGGVVVDVFQFCGCGYVCWYDFCVIGKVGYGQFVGMVQFGGVECVVFGQYVVFQVEVWVEILVEVDLVGIEVIVYVLWLQVDFCQFLVVGVGWVDVIVEDWCVVVVMIVVVVIIDVIFVYDYCGLYGVFMFGV